MKLSAAQSLNASSKKMLFILRILLVMLVFSVVIPWTFPKTALGNFLMSVSSITKFLDGSPDVDYFLNNLSGFSILLGVAGSIVNLAPLFIGVWIMIKLIKNYMAERVFNISNAKSYRNLGIVYLLSALLLQPLAQVLFSLSVSFINNHLGQRFIAFSIDFNTITEIFFAIVLIVIGHVMQLGQKIKEEQELTI